MAGHFRVGFGSQTDGIDAALEIMRAELHRS
jgi:hypothetical protein